MQQGALVRIQAEGRLQVLALQQQAPFLKATVAPLHDLASGQQAQQLAEGVEGLKQVMRVSAPQPGPLQLGGQVP